MNKQKTRYAKEMPKAYRMPISEFCMRYDRDLKVILHRLNTSSWLDYDALVVPTSLWDTKPPIIQRALILLERGWSHDEIARRLGIPVEQVSVIEHLSDYEKEVYKDAEKKYFKNYFHLNSAAIDVSRIFRERDPDEMVVNV